ncbi:unnamed protein product [Caretta caretta]
MKNPIQIITALKFGKDQDEHPGNNHPYVIWTVLKVMNAPLGKALHSKSGIINRQLVPTGSQNFYKCSWITSPTYQTIF